MGEKDYPFRQQFATSGPVSVVSGARKVVYLACHGLRALPALCHADVITHGFTSNLVLQSPVSTSILQFPKSAPSSGVKGAPLLNNLS